MQKGKIGLQTVFLKACASLRMLHLKKFTCLLSLL
jgi:hypothetical protein